MSSTDGAALLSAIWSLRRLPCVEFETGSGRAWNGEGPTQNKKKNTVYDYLELWNRDGTLERIHHALYVAVREEEGACHSAP
jgi:hypothetical protein